MSAYRSSNRLLASRPPTTRPRSRTFAVNARVHQLPCAGQPRDSRPHHNHRHLTDCSGDEVRARARHTGGHVPASTPSHRRDRRRRRHRARRHRDGPGPGGHLRAAGGRPRRPPPSSARPGVPGRCGAVPAQATRELRGMWLTTVNNIDWPSRPGLPAGAGQGRVPAVAGPGPGAEPQRDLRARPAQRRRVLAVEVRALVGVADRPAGRQPTRAGIRWRSWWPRRTPGTWNSTPGSTRTGEASPARTAPAPTSRKLAPNHPLRQHRDWAIAYPKGEIRPALLRSGHPRGAQVRRGLDAGGGREVRRGRRPLRRLLLPLPAGRAGLPGRRQLRRAGRQGAEPGGLAPGQRQHPGPGDERADQAGQAVGEVRDQPVRHLAQRQARPGRLADQRPGEQRRHLRRHPHLGPRGLARLRGAAAVLGASGSTRPTTPRCCPGGRRWSRAPRCSSTSGRATTASARRGPGATRASSRQQLALNDRYAVSGSVHFSAKQIKADRLGAVTRYRKAHYATPALLPVMSQLPADPPPAPRLVSGRKSAAGPVELDWQAGAEGTGQLGALPGRRRGRDPGGDRPQRREDHRARPRHLLPERPGPLRQRGPAERAADRQPVTLPSVTSRCRVVCTASSIRRSWVTSSSVPL